MQRIDKHPFYFLVLTIYIMLICACADHGQIVNVSADVKVENPTYTSTNSPKVVIDAAHANFHRATGRYQPLANFLTNDGFTIAENHELLSDSVLFAADVFVVANADFKSNGISFTTDEINAIKHYVHRGGSLLLIADHTPFPAAIEELASAFSIHFFDVFADDGGSGVFTKENGGLSEDPIFNGIDQIRTFGGSAFRIDTIGFRPLLLLGQNWTMQTMGPTGLSEKKSADGLLQGAIMHVGKGKVAVFGEAAMFTSQNYGRWNTRMGFHARGAKDNKKFILNLFHFLAV